MSVVAVKQESHAAAVNSLGAAFGAVVNLSRKMHKSRERAARDP